MNLEGVGASWQEIGIYVVVSTMSVSTSWNARTGMDFCGFLVGSSNWIL